MESGLSASEAGMNIVQLRRRVGDPAVVLCTSSLRYCPDQLRTFRPAPCVCVSRTTARRLKIFSYKLLCSPRACDGGRTTRLGVYAAWCECPSLTLTPKIIFCICLTVVQNRDNLFILLFIVCNRKSIISKHSYNARIKASKVYM